jgi:drug/metabolite transporter (DMT)-like permease
MGTVLALAAALCYGGADFLGGSATKRAPVLSVLLLSSVAGVVVVFGAALITGGALSGPGVAWGAAGGAVGSVGLMFFYQGLAAGPMNVVAPLSALVSTVLPVAVALATGEKFGLLVYAGTAACLASIALISSGGDAASQGGRARGISFGLIAGVAFGLFFLLLKYGGESGALWPAAAARVGGLITVMIVAGAAGVGAAGWRGDRTLVIVALLAGVLDSSANVCYILATRAGMFGIAVVMTSLYPGITILLARVLLGERLRGWQRAGLVLAGLGIVFVTV